MDDDELLGTIKMAAEAATRGEWESRLDRFHPDRGWREIVVGRQPVVTADSFDRTRRNSFSGDMETETHFGVRISPTDAAHICASNPQNVLRLLAMLEASRRERDSAISQLTELTKRSDG